MTYVCHLQENLEELATLESLDNGKPYSMAKAADVPLVSHLYPEISSCPIWSPGSLGAILQASCSHFITSVQGGLGHPESCRSGRATSALISLEGLLWPCRLLSS